MKPRFHLATDYIHLWLSCPHGLRLGSNRFSLAFSFSDRDTAFISADKEHRPHLSVVYYHHRIPTYTNKGFEDLRAVKQPQPDEKGEKLLQCESQTRVCGSQKKVLLEDRQHR
jgi:hypothetical protein